jgi:hypothetical protein
MATPPFNDVQVLQTAGGLGDGLASHAQDGCDGFLRHDQFDG